MELKDFISSKKKILQGVKIIIFQKISLSDLNHLSTNHFWTLHDLYYKNYCSRAFRDILPKFFWKID